MPLQIRHIDLVVERFELIVWVRFLNRILGAIRVWSVIIRVVVRLCLNAADA
jgi:hypothetical protein